MELLAVENIAQPKARLDGDHRDHLPKLPRQRSPSKRTMPAQIPRISRPRRPKAVGRSRAADLHRQGRPVSAGR